jgi:hypothetical protein
MDIAALGAAAAQVSGAQRQQQASLSGIKSAQVQAQSLVSILSSSAQTTQTQTAAQPVNSTGGTATNGASGGRHLPRGSLVNILA